MSSSKVEYTPVPLAPIEASQPAISETEVRMMKKSKRGVLLLCFLQLLIAFIDLLFGGLILMVVSALFISFGIVGVAKERPRLLVAHFVFSLALYVLSLISFVLLILYCESDCEWWLYAIGFFQILFQAVGMRHERMLIMFLKKKQGSLSCRVAQNCFQKEITAEQSEQCAINMENLGQGSSAPQPSVSNNGFNPMCYPMYPIPSHHMIPMEGQPRLPQYFPLQPVQYPMMQHPVQLSPYGQSQPGVGIYPVMYKV